MRVWIVWVVAAAVGLSSWGCYPPRHCQSGPKHGTKCYEQLSPDDPPATEPDDDDDPPPPSPPPTTPR